MTLFADRVQETTTTTGTGTLTLNSYSPKGSRTFAAAVTAGDLTDGGTTEICIVAVDGNLAPTGQWEACESVYTSTGNTVTRGTLFSSSTGSRVNFAAGTKLVFVGASASFLASLITAVSTSTLTNKRITNRHLAITSTATLTMNPDLYDTYYISAQTSALVIANSTGSASVHDGQFIEILDNGTSQTISYGTGIIAMGAAKTAATTANKRLALGLVRSGGNTVWLAYPAMIEV